MRSYDVTLTAGRFLAKLRGKTVVEIVDGEEHYVLVDGARHDLPPMPANPDAAARQLVDALRGIAAKL